MASSTIRKGIGAVKDQTSIALAKLSNNIAPDLDVAIVKATRHHDEPADEKHICAILNLASYSRSYTIACVSIISRRLGKTRNWVVALKTLMLVHRLLAKGAPAFHHQLVVATRRRTRLLNMSDFRDEAHSNSWDHSAFVRAYAMYLDLRLQCMVRYDNQSSGGGGGGNYGTNSNSNFSPPPNDERGTATPLRDMKMERVLRRMNQLQQLFDRFLACRPIGLAKNDRMIIASLYPIVTETFQLYADICEILAVLLDRYFDMDYAECVKSFEACANAAKQIDELNAFYGWCKDAGVARSSEYPEVQRITDKLLETLEEFMKSRTTRPNSPLRRVEPVHDMNTIKALHAPSDYEEQQVPEVPKPESRDAGTADWELALVDTASKLAKQKTALGGGFDPLLLNGMCEHGAVRQHVSAHASIGSASSVALPGTGGAVQNIGGDDPFAASLSIPPPSYVQMSDMAKKQQLLMQEQQLWHQHTHGGMQGQASLASRLNSAHYYPKYGIPTAAAQYYPNT